MNSQLKNKITNKSPKLSCNWNWYAHTKKNDWSINGYTQLYTINSIQDIHIVLNYLLKKDKTLFRYQYFIMKNDIKPTWEDKANINGGAWSFKTNSSGAKELWTEMVYYVLGETFSKKDDIINGISICFKNFSTIIVKVWNNNKKYSSIKLINTDLINKYKYSVVYKKHK